VTPAEAVALLKAIRDKAATAAPDMADAMGHVHERRMTDLLSRSFHAAPSWTSAPPGGPPAAMTGMLRGSVWETPGLRGGMRASSFAGPHTIYAGTQEYGAPGRTGRPNMWLWVAYVGPREVRARGWVRRVVNIPDRPYVRPSRDQVIGDGSVTAAASEVFMRHVFG
jgi:hypothetical protein